jgi:signal transduction histidine kinase
MRRADPVAFIKAAIDSVGRPLGAKQIQIEPTFSQTVETILGDSERLQQVVSNLLSNAITFTPSAGRFQVVVECASSQVARWEGVENGKPIATP